MFGMYIVHLIRSINARSNQILTFEKNYENGVTGDWGSTFVILRPHEVRLWFTTNGRGAKGRGKGGAVVAHHGPAGVVVQGPVGSPAHTVPRREAEEAVPADPSREGNVQQ